MTAAGWFWLLYIVGVILAAHGLISAALGMLQHFGL